MGLPIGGVNKGKVPFYPLSLPRIYDGKDDKNYLPKM
jgi:hypothetical protein